MPLLSLGMTEMQDISARQDLPGPVQVLLLFLEFGLVGLPAQERVMKLARKSFPVGGQQAENKDQSNHHGSTQRFQAAHGPRALYRRAGAGLCLIRRY
jgi:hypothetical protein